MVDLDQRQQLGHAVEIGREARHKAALSVRPAMPPMIERIDGIAPTGQTFRNMRVAPGMFGIAVREQHDGARALFGKPVGDVEVRARPGRFGGKLDRTHRHTRSTPFALSLSKGRTSLGRRRRKDGASTSSAQTAKRAVGIGHASLYRTAFLSAALRWPGPSSPALSIFAYIASSARLIAVWAVGSATCGERGCKDW